MKNLLSVLTLAVAVTPAFTQSSLNNGMIIKLVNSGMAEDAVIRIVNSQPGDYANSPEAITALQQAGVTRGIINAVVNHQNAGSDPQAQPASEMELRDGTPVRMRLARTLSSADTASGEQIDFDVLDDIRVGDRVVIPRGTKAIGSITVAEHRKRMARGGKLNYTLDFLRLADGTKVALRAVHETSGNGHVGAMTIGIAATALFVAPVAAPFFLLMHGKDVVIPQGTEITAYVNGDVQLPPGAFLASR